MTDQTAGDGQIRRVGPVDWLGWPARQAKWIYAPTCTMLARELNSAGFAFMRRFTT